MHLATKIILVGGSAGSLPLIIKMIGGLKPGFPFALVLIIHRQKNVDSEMSKILGTYSKPIQIIEPDDKQPILSSTIYLAPQNYHLLMETDKIFSLDYSERVLHSRPAIDVTFESAACAFKQNAVAIVLSGANADGAKGLSAVLNAGGKGLVQDPETAAFNVMPLAAIAQNPSVQILAPEKLISFICNI